MTTTADVSVLVCRGCCCGSSQKHPDTDHDRQLERVTNAVLGQASARVVTTACLGPCERSNVMVVRAGSARRWFGDLLTDEDTDSLIDWVLAGAPPTLPTRLAARQFDPAASGSVMAQPVGLDAGALADRVEHILREGAGGWTLGVEGAAAEFAAPAGRPEVHRRGSVIEAVTGGGALRLNIEPPVTAFSITAPATGDLIALFLAVPRALLTAPATGLVDRGPDRQAIVASDREARLFDLAIGQATATFGVRTADPELQAALARWVTAPWYEVVGAIGPLLVTRSPHRVIETAAGRAEVYSAIPPPDGQSPVGAHTHLSPEHLEVGNELPTLFALPGGWAPAAMFHPPPGWKFR